jgi:hypothetical protein
MRFLFLAVAFLAACTQATVVPTEEPLTQADIEAAVELTLAARVTNTPHLADTPAPTATDSATATSAPTKIALPTATEAESLESLRADLIRAVMLILDGEYLNDLESTNLVRVAGEGLEIELVNKWASQDVQPNLSFELLRLLAPLFNEWTEQAFDKLLGNPDPVILIRTYSATGAYVYESRTDWETFQLLAQKAISYDEWVASSGAGFQ